MRMSERARAHVHGDSGRSKPPVGGVLFLLDRGVRFRKLDLFGHDLILQCTCTLYIPIFPEGLAQGCPTIRCTTVVRSECICLWSLPVASLFKSYKKSVQRGLTPFVFCCRVHRAHMPAATVTPFVSVSFKLEGSESGAASGCAQHSLTLPD